MTTPQTLIATLQQPALHQLLQQRATQPFAWGRTDCVLWVADAWRAMAGTDLAADIRGRYHDLPSARRLLRRLGARTLADVLCRRLQPVTGPRRDGDIGLGQSGPDDRIGALAIRLQGWAIGQGTQGLLIVAQRDVASWWRAPA